MSYEDEGIPIDWENPFTEIRSSEIESIELDFNDNGRKLLKEDDKGDLYTQFKFKCTRLDMSNPAEIVYITSSKKLIKQLELLAPVKDKEIKIIKSGTGFQTMYVATLL